MGDRGEEEVAAVVPSQEGVEEAERMTSSRRRGPKGRDFLMLSLSRRDLSREDATDA